MPKPVDGQGRCNWLSCFDRGTFLLVGNVFGLQKKNALLAGTGACLYSTVEIGSCFQVSVFLWFENEISPSVSCIKSRSPVGGNTLGGLGKFRRWVPAQGSRWLRVSPLKYLLPVLSCFPLSASCPQRAKTFSAACCCHHDFLPKCIAYKVIQSEKKKWILAQIPLNVSE
jgi:hypothetical protein